GPPQAQKLRILRLNFRGRWQKAVERGDFHGSERRSERGFTTFGVHPRRTLTLLNAASRNAFQGCKLLMRQDKNNSRKRQQLCQKLPSCGRPCSPSHCPPSPLCRRLPRQKNPPN